MTESETDFSSWFRGLAQVKGWLCVHFRPAMTGRTYTNKRGETKPVWVTAFEGAGAGFPDWFLVHEERQLIWYIELKGTNGNMTGEQVDWIETLAACGQYGDCFWPEHRDIIEGLL